LAKSYAFSAIPDVEPKRDSIAVALPESEG
jgi:hypothetical protein